MWTRALDFVFSVMWSRSLGIVIGIALFCVAGVIAGAGAAAIVRRKAKARPLVVDGWPLALAFFIFCLVDWAFLRALPLLRLSFATNIVPPLVASFLVRFTVLWCLLWAALIARAVGRRRGFKLPLRWLVITLVVANLLFSGVQVDAYVVEPLLIETTRVQLAFADLDAAAPAVRVVHLTDTHIERYSYREAAIVERVNALQPDIIVLTGDYLNLSRLSDPVSADHFRQLVGQLPF